VLDLVPRHAPDALVQGAKQQLVLFDDVDRLLAQDRRSGPRFIRHFGEHAEAVVNGDERKKDHWHRD
jgi:hypothetical protein